jgi:hypothetical protein
MSNNVMWLVNKRLKRCRAIAKYYPGTGWYPYPGKTLDEPFMDEIDFSPHGPTDWEIQYDVADGEKEFVYNNLDWRSSHQEEALLVEMKPR